MDFIKKNYFESGIVEMKVKVENLFWGWKSRDGGVKRQWRRRWKYNGGDYNWNRCKDSIIFLYYKFNEDIYGLSIL